MDRHLYIARFLTVLLSLCFLTACSDSEERDEEGAAMLYLNVFVPSSQLTRADVGPVAAKSNEKAVHSLHIWVYNHEAVTLENGTTLPAGVCVAYLNPSVNDLQSGTAQQFAITIDTQIARRHANVDVYVVANEGSIGINGLGSNTTREQLEAIKFSGNAFGLSSLTTASDIAAAGLPMAGVLKNVAMRSDKAPMYEVETVTLTRCVSKVRFVFCRLDGEVNDVFTLDEIRLNGSVIAAEEYLINDTGAPTKFVSGSYEASPILLTGSSVPSLPTYSQIPVHNKPSDFIYTDQTAQDYESLIDNAISSNHLRQVGPIYLRESDRRISGTITYRVKQPDGTMQAKTTNFSMADEGDFARNHTWTVYSYFLGGKLYVVPVVKPWTAATDRFNYYTQGSTTMEWNSYLRYDVDEQSNTWGDTYVSVAYGYRNTATHEPLYSTPITLRTTNTNELWVQVDNDQFQLIRKEGSSYEMMGQRIVIEAGSEDALTEFYVVPVSANNPPNPLTKVTVTARPANGMPPFNIPFNHDLPGDEDHTSILVYNIGAQTYSANQNNKKISGNNQGKQYWVESNV